MSILDLEREAPWFSGAWSEAIGYLKKDHSMAESALGLAGMIARGQGKEAEKVYRTQLKPQLIRRRAGNFSDAEIDSTQLRSMVDSEMYPKDLCDEIRRLF